MTEPEPKISPGNFFLATRRKFPSLHELFDEGDVAIPAVGALAREWHNDYIPAEIEHPWMNQLHGRCYLFAVAATYRALDLAGGIARALEADSLFGAGALARSQLELIGLTCLARERLAGLTAPLDASALNTETARLLLGSKHGPVAPYPTAELVEAAKRQIGEDRGGDYALLNDLAHPNGLLAWTASMEEEALKVIRPAVSEAACLIIVQLCAKGVHTVAHNAQWLIEWIVEQPNPLLSTPSGDDPE